MLAWTHVSARQTELASALRGSALIPPRSAVSWPTTLRYIVSSVWTVYRLSALRPRAVIVTCPPIPLGLLAWALSKPLRFTLVLDSHPGAFGLMGDGLSSRLQGLHIFLVRRARYTVVTTPSLRRRVDEWGGTGGLLHEPPKSKNSGRVQRLHVLFPLSGGRDEPLGVMFALASAVPELTFVMTGERERITSHRDYRDLPNLKLTGWLEGDEFDRLIADASVVVSLSTEAESVMRTAYEAVYYEKPLVVTRTPATLEYFPHAAHAENSVAELQTALHLAMECDENTLVAHRRFAEATWSRHLAALRTMIEGA